MGCGLPSEIAGSSILRLGLVVNAAVVAVWIVSRTTGLPVGPSPGTPEPFGGADLAATGFELGSSRS